MSFTDRFTHRADAYVAGRPSYPPEAIAAIFAGLGEPGSLAVADVGAGTGISSRLLADLGARVFAIEPNAAMRQAAQPHPRLTWVDATAEHTTLPDASVDVVTAFQAWHWFDPDAVAAEARRILRPGGRLAIVYNERDERDPFTAAYGDLVRRYATDATEQRRSTAALGKAAGIDPALTVREEFRNTHPLDRAGLHARARSTSYLPREGPEADALHARIDAIFDRFATADEIPMHLVTSVTRVGFS